MDTGRIGGGDAGSLRGVDLVRRGVRATPVVGVVTGSGQVAQSAVEAGADFLLVLNSGLYRSQGAGSLAAFLFGQIRIPETTAPISFAALPSFRKGLLLTQHAV